MLTWMVWMGKDGEQPADLAGGQRDEAGRVVVITRRGYLGRLSTAAGAPLSCADLKERKASASMDKVACRYQASQLGAVTIRSELLTAPERTFMVLVNHDRGPVHARLTQDHAQHARHPQGR
jgi:hypothetical protein